MQDLGFKANTAVIVDPVNSLGVTKHLSETVYAYLIKYKCNYLAQPPDTQQYRPTVSIKHGLCVLGAAHLVNINCNYTTLRN
jgi:hypothetical protein